jgi:hypothetical protein
MCPGVDSVSKNEYQKTPGGKDSRCVRVLKVEKIRSFNLPDPQGPARACSGKTLPLLQTCIIQNLELLSAQRHKFARWKGFVRPYLPEQACLLAGWLFLRSRAQTLVNAAGSVHVFRPGGQISSQTLMGKLTAANTVLLISVISKCAEISVRILLIHLNNIHQLSLFLRLIPGK